jgi:hypothetical protein
LTKQINPKTRSKGELKMPKNKRTDSNNHLLPLIAFEEVTAEKESFRLSWTVLANLREYVTNVKEVTGKETTPDDVVDKGMQRLFDADRGFHQWLQKKNAAGKLSAKSAQQEQPGKPEKSLAEGKPSVPVEPSAKLQS